MQEDCTDGINTCLIAVVHQDEEEVEAAHDGGGQVDVLLQTFPAVVAPSDRVGCSQDGGASIQGGLEETEAKSCYCTAEAPERPPFGFGLESCFERFLVARAADVWCL